MYDPNKARKAQAKYCADNEMPNFAGDGECSRCGKNAFMPVKYIQNGKTVVKGYDVEYAASHSITGCPHCGYSFIE